MGNFSNYLHYSLIIIPLIAIYTSSLICPVSPNSGNTVPFRPPGYIFAIIWPILLLLLGFAWFEINKFPDRLVINNTIFILLIIFLCLWQVFYSCLDNKINSIYIIFIALLLSIIAYTVSGLNSKLAICPLITWLIFAGLLNCFETIKN